MGTYLHQFANDKLLQAVLVLIVVDLLLGVTASLRTNTFRLSYISDFIRTDVLGKVFPWFVLDAAGIAAPNTDIAGVSLSDLATAAGVVVTAALVGSLLSSVNDLFPGITIPKGLGDGEKPHTSDGQ